MVALPDGLSSMKSHQSFTSLNSPWKLSLAVHLSRLNHEHGAGSLSPGSRQEIVPCEKGTPLIILASPTVQEESRISLTDLSSTFSPIKEKQKKNDTHHRPKTWLVGTVSISCFHRTFSLVPLLSMDSSIPLSLLFEADLCPGETVHGCCLSIYLV